MAPLDLSSPELYAEHVTETHRTVNPDHTVTEQELPGFIIVGIVLNGVRKELARFKAGGFLDDLRRHQEAQAQRGGGGGGPVEQTSGGGGGASTSPGRAGGGGEAPPWPGGAGGSGGVPPEGWKWTGPGGTGGASSSAPPEQTPPGAQ